MNPLVRTQGTGFNVTTYRWVSYGLVAAMMTCAAYTTVNLITHIRPTWQPWYVVVICLLVAVDRLYTYRRFRDWMVFSKEWLLRFGTELIIIVALTRLVVGVSHGWPAFLAEIPLWRQDFGTYFLIPEYWVVLILVLTTWAISGNFAALLDDIGLDEDEILKEAVAPLPRRRSTRERLMSLFFGIGAVLVLFTALSRVDLRLNVPGVNINQLVVLDLPALAGGGGSTLLFFMLGLGLLSQTQFITLHVRWDTRSIPVSAILAGRWAIYSLGFLAILAALVSLLPTSYSLSPLELLHYLLNLVLFVLLWIGKAIVDMVLALFELIASPLLPKSSLKLPKLPLPPTPGPQTLPGGGAGIPPAWWQLLQSLAFWGIFLAVLIFSVVQYLREHQGVLDTLRKVPGWHLLVRLWGWMNGLFSNVKNRVTSAVQAGQARLRARRDAARERFGRGFISLRKLDARQRVAFFYLALVRRGGESGLPRSQSQTPSEYALTLESALPDVDREIASLTDAFIEARYTQRPVQPEKAGLVRAAWEKVRSALRGHGEMEKKDR